MENYYITPNGNMISGRRVHELMLVGKTKEEIFADVDREQRIIDGFWEGVVLKSISDKGSKKEN